MKIADVIATPPPHQVAPDGKAPGEGEGALQQLTALLAEGERYLQGGKLEEARSLARRLAQSYPELPPSLYFQGVVAYKEGQLPQAERLLRGAIARASHWSAAYQELANVLIAQGKFTECIAVLTPHLAAAGNQWKLHYSLARCYDAAAESVQSIAHFNHHLGEALRLSGDPATIYGHLARGRLANKDYQGAERALRAVLTIKPDNSETQLSLAETLIQRGRREEATALLQHVKDSGDIVLLSRLASVIWEQKEFDPALAILQKITMLAPDNVEAWFNYASALMQAWRLELASEACDRTLALGKGMSGALALKANIEGKRGNVAGALQMLEQILQQQPEHRAIRSNLAFTALYSAAWDAEKKFQLHRELAAAIEREVQPYSDWPWGRHTRLRIGYVSADFRDQHPVGIFITPVLAHHERSRFEVFCYYNSNTSDASTAAVRRLSEHWRNVAGWSDEKLCKQIRSDEIDILIDLSGHTAQNRLGTFARRPAKCSLSMIGYPHSTGMSRIDYFLADPMIASSGSESLYSERLLHTQHSVFCYPKDGGSMTGGTLRSTPRDHVVFGSFNNLIKVTEKTVELWAAILKQTVNSRLLMKTPSFFDQATRELYRTRFASYGIEAERIELRGPSELGQMMDEYNDVDIGLDPIPFNGGTTTYQALWMGVPVVTLSGDNFCSRMGASILHTLGLDEFVATSEGEYVARAVAWAEQPTQLRQLKGTLRERMRNSPLCDNLAYTRHLEALYEQISGEAPAH
ncbi:MAG TPA: tetratricopeptide repeat protein [Gammaproteobacteria bacterium]